MTGAIDQQFWDGASIGRLRLPRCDSCGKWTWPPQPRCGLCGSWSFVWETTQPTGKIHSVTWTRHPFAAGTEVPYANLLVELSDAGGARLLGLLAAGSPSPNIGDAVEAAFDRNETGDAVVRWRVLP